MEILAKSKLPRFSYNQVGEPTLLGWEENSIAAALLKVIVADVPVYCYRVVSIVEARDFVAVSKAMAKKQLHESTDVEMADATRPSPSIQSMIDKAVSASLKKIAPSKGGTKKVSRTPRHNDYPSNESLEKFGWQEGEEEHDAFSQGFSYSTEAISAEAGTSSPHASRSGPKPNKGKGKGKGKK
jgi:acetolactate synthase regulatory subunit